MATADEKLKHAVAITDRETKAFVWGLVGQGLPAIGDGITAWALNTLAEHFRSLLDPDLSKQTQDERDILADLDRIANEFNSKLTGKYGAQPIPEYPYQR